MTVQQGQFLNIASHVATIAQRAPQTLSVAIQHARRGGRFSYERITAAQLDAESDRTAEALLRAGLGRGLRTVLMVPPSREFFVLTFALFKLGAVPVMVDPGMGIRNLGRCLDDAQPHAFIGVPKAHAARTILGWARKWIRMNVTVGRRLFWGGRVLHELPCDNSGFEMTLTGRDEMAAILFTSGNTGPPKGAVYTHGTFDAQVRSLRQDYGIEPGEIDCATFPLFALFGPALGMASVVPDMNASRPITANPRNLIAAIHEFQATNLFASPALIDKLGRFGHDSGERLPSLKRVISAGAPCEPDALERFAKMLSPEARILPSYGATEALPVATIDHNELLRETAALTAQGAGVCVGRPVRDVNIRIMRVTDEPVPQWRSELELNQGERGEICVAGPMVTREYYNRPEATAQAKTIDNSTGHVYHRMGDIGYFDGQGRLWFCGRKGHRVVSADGPMDTIPCERIFHAHANVRRAALVGVQRAGRTVPVLCVQPERKLSSAEQKRLRDELLELAGQNAETKPIETVLFHSNFPVDIRHNAKIFRERLAVWAEKQLR